MSPSSGVDVAVIGGGLVGSAIACGLLRAGCRVAMLDEGDVAYRASRGNFALVWVQGKGMGLAPYAAWSRRSSDLWPELALSLQAETGIDLGYRRPGGFALALSEAELERRSTDLERLQSQAGMVPYDYEILDRPALAKVLPCIGPEVAGASYCPLDGDANSLRLFRALHTAFVRGGGRYLPCHAAERIVPGPGAFRIEAGETVLEAGRVVLAAGIGNARLAPMVGLDVPVRPQRGQIIVTERTAPFLHHPTSTVRQTDEGGVMIGDSLEEAGLDIRVGLGVLATMADRAVRMFPAIGRLNVVRTWAALRVMTPDGFPIYEESREAPGAFVCTCHSGVTLAAAHMLAVAPMIARGSLDPALAPFGTERLHVQASAGNRT